MELPDFTRDPQRIVRHYIAPAFGVLVLLFLLQPRGWEPGGESWTAWAAARRLAETGTFSVASRNGLYVVYLLVFRELPFPYSMIIEHAVTYGFALFAIY